MVVVKYIGKTTKNVGKTLWDIVGNLKNFGVGRTVVRSINERYPEKTFYKIVKVEALPAGGPLDYRKVNVFVEMTFRGHKHDELENLVDASHLHGFKLLSKEEEIEYCKVDKVYPKRILPGKMELPPLMKHVLVREFDKKGTKFDPETKIPIDRGQYYGKIYKFYEFKDPEKSDDFFPNILDTNESPTLYGNIEEYKKKMEREKQSQSQ